MGEAKRRGSLEERKATPKGKTVSKTNEIDRKDIEEIVKNELLKHRMELFKLGIPQ